MKSIKISKNQNGHFVKNKYKGYNLHMEKMI